MATEKSAGAVVYRYTDDGKLYFLLLQSAPGKPWGFPKGKLNPGETEDTAARREIAEETGLSEMDFDPGFRLIITYHFRRGRKLINKDVVYFLARAHSAVVHISWEHVAYRWMPIDEAFDMVIYENARDTLRRAYEYLQAAADLHRNG